MSPIRQHAVYAVYQQIDAEISQPPRRRAEWATPSPVFLVSRTLHRPPSRTAFTIEALCVFIDIQSPRQDFIAIGSSGVLGRLLHEPEGRHFIPESSVGHTLPHIRVYINLSLAQNKSLFLEDPLRPRQKRTAVFAKQICFQFFTAAVLFLVQ